MQFGVREICDVVLRARSNQKVGNRIFYKNEPVLYFDTLTTSSMEGAATTVYAQGGKGNARLVSWDGERTVTWNMTDALLSPEGFAILSGAGLIQGDEIESTNADGSVNYKKIIVHQTERVEVEAAEDGETPIIRVSNKPYVPDSKENYIYVMVLDSNGQVKSEPYLYECGKNAVADSENRYAITMKTKVDDNAFDYTSDSLQPSVGEVVLVDYYSDKSGAGASGVYQFDITPDKFGGAYYLEASTLFRDRATGKDMPAEFIIPNCRIQSNFTFTMASSGDPSTFDFVIDAFPDYTRFNKTQKVLAEIQVIGVDSDAELTRIKTKSDDILNSDGIIVDQGTKMPSRPQVESPTPTPSPDEQPKG